jgi:dienelactone hydrolase
LTWVKRQPKLAGRPVVLLGSSRGAEAALLVAGFYPTDLSAVVLGSPTDEVNRQFGGYANGSTWTIPGQGIPVGEKIPLGRVTMPVLIGAGGKDEIWNSSLSASYIMAHLPKVKPGSSASVHVNLTYHGAGHEFVAPPYVPYDVAGRGGTEESNQLALEAFWPRLTAFLTRY